MGQLGVVAIDSVKLASDASLSATAPKRGCGKAAAEQAAIDRSGHGVAAAAAAEHAATDAAEDELYGPGRRGDEVPEDLRDERSRTARIEQAIEELKAQSGAGGGIVKRPQRVSATASRNARSSGEAQARRLSPPARAARTAPWGSRPARSASRCSTEDLAAIGRAPPGQDRRYSPLVCASRAIAHGPADARVRRVQAALDRAIAERAALDRPNRPPATGRAAGCRRLRPREPKRNITDPQSRMMPLRGGGWVQGYNCQAATSSDGLIIATSVGNNSTDATAFCAPGQGRSRRDAHRHAPAQHRRSSAGIGMVLADAGYLSTDNLTAPDRTV